VNVTEGAKPVLELVYLNARYYDPEIGRFIWQCITEVRITMMRRRTLKVVPFFALPLLAFVCGEQYKYAPVVHNTLARPIVVSIQYRNGQSSSSVEFAPGAKGWAPAEGIAIDEIEVRSEGEVLFKLGKDELERLRAGLPPGARLMWEIQEDGVTPTIAPE
jgi:hypothetical protein